MHRTEIKLLYLAQIWDWGFIRCIDLSLNYYTMHWSNIEQLSNASIWHWTIIQYTALIWDKAVFTLQWFEIVILYVHALDLILSYYKLHWYEIELFYTAFSGVLVAVLSVLFNTIYCTLHCIDLLYTALIWD